MWIQRLGEVPLRCSGCRAGHRPGGGPAAARPSLHINSVRPRGKVQTLICLVSLSAPAMVILRGLAFSAIGIRRVSTPAS
jgi:hypothetical protein